MIMAESLRTNIQDELAKPINREKWKKNTKLNSLIMPSFEKFPFTPYPVLTALQYKIVNIRIRNPYRFMLKRKYFSLLHLNHHRW